MRIEIEQSGKIEQLDKDTSEITSCDTLDTDAAGNLFCGADSSGGGALLWNTTGSNIYLNETTHSVGIGVNITNTTLTIAGNQPSWCRKPIQVCLLVFVHVSPAFSFNYSIGTYEFDTRLEANSIGDDAR